MGEADIIVVGGGIAGASLAYFASQFASVIVLERESRCGYHSTGRSAASFTENYGTDIIRRLAIASRPFLETPPEGFCDHPILKQRGTITIARLDQLSKLAEELDRSRCLVSSIQEIDPAEVLRRVPILRDDYVAGAIFEPHSMDLDVDQLHQGYLAGVRRFGSKILTSCDVMAMERSASRWNVVTSSGQFRCQTVVNAAGAWADDVAELAGVRRLGLQPKRRTAFNIPLPSEIDASGWPLIDDIGETFYFKPDAGQLLVSPADATPSEPMDAWPDDLDIAEGVERLSRATTLTVTRTPRAWAGLRTFASDGSPVVGRDRAEPSFVWLAGQGGYGIKTSPALGMIGAELIRHDRFPKSMIEQGIQERELSPSRFGGSTASSGIAA